MDTMSAFLPLLHAPQACLSAYVVYLSSIAVPKLQQYEEKSEKAAQYSNAAEHQLHKTRTTQTSGALTVSRLGALMRLRTCSVLAFVSAIVSLRFHCASFGSSSGYSEPAYFRWGRVLLKLSNSAPF